MTTTEKRYLSKDENIFRVEYSGNLEPIEHDEEPVLRHAGRSGAVVEVEGLIAVKTHELPAAFEQESAAYEFLKDKNLQGVPRLMNINKTARRITMERIFGKSLRETSPEADARRHWKLAGEWLRKFHHLPVPDDTKQEFSTVAQQRIDRALAMVADAASDDIRAHAARVRDELSARTIPTVARVRVQGDFGPQNWILRRDSVFAVIDYEHMTIDFPEADFVNLLPMWEQSESLRRGFLQGYRDPRREISEERLRVLQFVVGLERMAYGVQHQLDAYIKSGRELAALAVSEYGKEKSYLHLD